MTKDSPRRSSERTFRLPRDRRSMESIDTGPREADARLQDVPFTLDWERGSNCLRKFLYRKGLLEAIAALLVPLPNPRDGGSSGKMPWLEGVLMSFLIELWSFLRARKKFWLLPILVMMVIFGGLIVLSQGSAVAPFIYTLF